MRWLVAVARSCGMSGADIADAEFFELWDVARVATAAGRAPHPAAWGLRAPPGSLLAAMMRGPAGGGGPRAI